MQKPIKAIYSILLIITLISGTAYLKKQQKIISNSKASSSILRVTAIHPTFQKIQETINLSGFIIPKEDVLITTDLLPIKIKQILVEEGTTVHAGQKLAILDDSSIGYKLEQLQANFNQADKEYKRAIISHKNGVISTAILEQKYNSYMAFKAQLNNAKLQVSNAVITAPVDGLLYSKNVKIGNLVSNNEPLFRIAQNRLLELEVDVTETDLNRIRIGQKVIVSTEGSNSIINGTINTIPSYIKPGTYSAKLRISLEPYNLPVGAFCKASILLREKEALVLPKTAIMTQDNKQYAWIVTNENNAIKMPIKIGINQGDILEIEPQESINKDTQIIAKGWTFLNDGDKVIVAQDTK
jgi:RND family efflux transporter MFP subunit